MESYSYEPLWPGGIEPATFRFSGDDARTKLSYLAGRHPGEMPYLDGDPDGTQPATSPP